MNIIDWVKEKLNAPRTRHTLIVAGTVILTLWVVFRLVVVYLDGRIDVYNPSRAAISDGVPVQTLTVKSGGGILRVPIAVNNNRAYVSAARVGQFRAGQKVGAGHITYVSSGLDLDTGMYVIRTRGVSDGLNYVEIPVTGYMVPLYAVDNNTVMVARDGVAMAAAVTVSRSDADNALITSGLNDGDVIILSDVNDGARIQQ